MTTTEVPSSTETLTGDDFVATRAYTWLRAEEAARDPRTPESYLIFEIGLRSEEQLFAMLERRPVSAEFVGYLVKWASSPRGTSAVLTSASKNRAVLAATELPHLTSTQLGTLVDGLDRFADAHTEAALAIARHPAADEHVAARVLCFGDGAFGTGTRLEQFAGSAGHLSATALRLLRTEGLRPRATQREALGSVLEIVAELEAAVGNNPHLRRVLAALGPTWTGDRASLLTTSVGVSAPA